MIKRSLKVFLFLQSLNKQTVSVFLFISSFLYFFLSFILSFFLSFILTFSLSFSLSFSLCPQSRSVYLKTNCSTPK